MFDRLAAIDLIADTIKAYVQSLLKVQLSNDLLFHMKLWPQDGTWEKLGFQLNGSERPMCRLYKALYGHPESGALWDAYLTAAIQKCDDWSYRHIRGS